MWTKPWTFKEGFLIGGGLIFAGLMLELSVGPVMWDAFAWPANAIVLAGFFVMLTAMAYLRKKIYAFQWMTTYQAAIPTTASKRHVAEQYAVVLAVRTYLCVYHGDSGTHHPSQITSNIQR